MRLKRVEVSAELIERFLTVGNTSAPLRILEGLPEGAKLRFVHWWPGAVAEGHQRIVWLDFEHESFPESTIEDAPAPLRIILQQTAELLPGGRSHGAMS